MSIVDCMIGKIVLIRGTDAGVFVGMAEAIEAQQAGTSTAFAVKLKDARRIWYWSGASSISELARRGVSRPAQCKFPAAVEEQIVCGVIEIIPLTDEARKSIDGVPAWTQFKE